jgi:hypothetical protein
MRREDVERIRRSMALAPALPPEQARVLLEEVDRLLRREERLGELLVELRQVFPELRRLLNELAATHECAR